MESEGGAIFIDTAAPHTVVIDNCLFERNEATWDGGATSCGSKLVVRGCTFADNVCLNVTPTGGTMNFWASSIGIESSILSNNLPIELSGNGPGFEVIPSYSNIEGDWSGPGSAMGIDNVDVDPQLSSPILGDYTVNPRSPMIDAGVATGSFDLDLGPRTLDDTQICDTGPTPTWTLMSSMERVLTPLLPTAPPTRTPAEHRGKSPRRVA
ncbi:MAG: hypothetical protein ACI8QS_000887 [Planctomycetota bacterium]